MTPLVIQSIDPLIEKYQLLLVDQFGVLHDGATIYPGVIEALERIRDSGTRIVIISNSGKRAVVNEARLSDMGIERKYYSSLVTSGEVAFSELKNQIDTGLLRPGAQCFLFANDGDLSAVSGLDLTITPRIESADYIVLGGILGKISDLDYYAKLFQQPLARGVPMVCTNPDKWVLSSGTKVMGAGRVAEYYESAGGRVQWIGKPYAPIYQWILANESMADKTEQVVCIGDSIEHDIAGGQAQQLATALVQTGIHTNAGNDELASAYKTHNAQPDYLLPGFR